MTGLGADSSFLESLEEARAQAGRARFPIERAVPAALLLLLLGAVALQAQEPSELRRKFGGQAGQPMTAADSARADSARTDSTRPRPGQAIDTAQARRLGLPTGPRRNFAPDDSIVTDLLNRPGYQATRYRSDSAIVFAEERQIYLRGEASTKRDLTTLEADSIAYQESDCMIHARGDPALFDHETVLTGFGGIRYNTCIHRGIVTDALTSFKQGGSDWFLRGNLAQDSSASRLYASDGNITSCDLPVPHYHFSAREVKWISKTVMVARPAVLYIRDVPILWLPFVFQDARPGRRSGILIPRFGLNDIVRQNPGYQRQITNIGYYWAPNEYFDATAKLDWFSDRYVQYGGAAQYRWLNQFLSGAIAYNNTAETDGARSTNLRWDHRQNFDLSTSLNLSINYTSNGSVVSRNAIDPLLSTQQIVSAVNFSKRYSWGTIALGGNRRQNLSDNSVSMELPSVSVSPKPLDIGSTVTWSPSLSFSNSYQNNFALSPTPLAILPGGILDSIGGVRDTRTTTVDFETPLRFGEFTWRNSFTYNDTRTDGRTVVGAGGLKVPDTSTPDPTDSITVSEVAVGDFESDLDWQTGINLPTLLRSSWKLQPSVGIANATSGSFLVRNRNTDGRWVRQGKRFSLGLTASPTFFGFFPGFGPIGRIRHSISPIITFNYSPAASIDSQYAAAIALPGQPIELRSLPTQTLSIGLTQNIEGKSRDTSATGEAKRFRILGIQTSSMQYDFEQAKQPGYNGWRTQTITNQFASDLLPGFNLSLTHDLWRGTVGVDTAKFDPFLQSVTASFAISGNTINSILRLFGLGKPDSLTSKAKPPASYVASQSQFGRTPSFYGYGTEQTVGLSTHRSFSANFNYSLSRERPEPTINGIVAPPPQQSLGFSTSFAPTAFWTVSWSSQYNITLNRFESQVVRLERVLHEWRASFNFAKNPNGNFAFFFSVYLSDMPDIKFDYNQTSIVQ